MPTKYSKSFQGDNNANANNELASHNRFIFQFDGVAIAMVVGFFLLLVTSALIYMCVKFGGMVVIAVVVSFCLIVTVGVIATVVIISSVTIRHISTTKAQVQIDRNNEEWSRIAYPVGAHIVVKNPYTRELNVHNASIVTQNHTYPAPQALSEKAESAQMPDLYTLSKDDEA